MDSDAFDYFIASTQIVDCDHSECCCGRLEKWIHFGGEMGIKVASDELCPKCGGSGMILARREYD